MLDIQSLSVQFRRYGGVRRRVDVSALTDVSLSLARGEVLALVGASGSGKSILAQAILGLLPSNAIASGTISIDGKPLDAAQRRLLCNTALALMPQSLSYLDPLARCGHQIAWSAQRSGRTGTFRDAVDTGLARFHLAPSVSRAFPHELSGGMARRVLLAIAAAGTKELLIADEPTSGLDGTNAAAVLAYLRRLADDGHAVMVITHDLSTALPWADTVAIVRDGHLEAMADARLFHGDGQGLPTPYTRALWQALPQNRFGLTS